MLAESTFEQSIDPAANMLRKCNIKNNIFNLFKYII